MPERVDCSGTTPSAGMPAAGRVADKPSWGRAALAGLLLLSLAPRLGAAQASASIRATVTVVDPAPSAFPVATARLFLDRRLTANQLLRRDLGGATLLVEAPVRLSPAPARRITVIHW